MKKFLKIFLIILLIVVAGLLWTRYQMQSRLKAFQSGGIYQGMGLKITLPPAEPGTKGLFLPYLSFGVQPITLQFLQPPPFQVVGAKLRTCPWDRKHALLTIDEYKIDKLKLAGVAFYLKSPSKISQLTIRDIVIPQPKKEFKFSNLKLSFDNENPDQWEVKFNLGFLSLRGPEGAAAISNGVQFNKLALVLKSVTREQRDHWEVVGDIRSIDLLLKEDATPKMIPLKGLHFNYLGSIKHASITRRQEITQEIKSVFDGVLKDPKNPLMLLDNLSTWIAEFAPMFSKAEGSWDGLHYTNKEKNQSLDIKPMKALVLLEESPNGFSVNADMSAKGFKIKTADHEKKVSEWELGEVRATSASIYPGMSYANFLSAYYRYLGKTFQNQLGVGELWPFYLTALAQYPLQWKSQLGVAQLSYQDGESNFNLKDLTVALDLNENGLEYMISAAGSANLPKLPVGTLENLSAKLKMGFKYPWQSIRSYAQGMLAESQPNRDMAPFFQTLLKGQYGVNLYLMVDLRPQWFSDEIDLKTSINLKDLNLNPEELTSEPLSKNPAVQSKVLPYLWQKLEISYLNKINSLSAFEKFLDKIKPGTSSSLMMITPYAVIDRKADTLSMEFSYKDGKALVNGQPNPQIDQLIQTFLK
ncbi:MAG: hypothetical protein HYU97_03720 [Deltaproteobacteria bacterium]|nr:hypothetical protein [Deltaproteobacteria bacterium]